MTLTAPLKRTSGENYGRWINSANWVEYVLRRPDPNHSPGIMVYSTGASHVLGAALTEATGQSLHALARDYLGEPLGINIPPWTRDPQGYYFGGNNMAMTPRAMLRIAAMVRDDGRWEGRQVISSNWIADSMTIRAYSPWSGCGYHHVRP